MQFRKITTEQAHEALAVLREECGYVADNLDGYAFVRAVTTESSDREKVCQEYRFQGALGFGGKFRNNGNRFNTPYVDCYPEDETNERSDMIIRANNRLAAIFPIQK